MLILTQSAMPTSNVMSCLANWQALWVVPTYRHGKARVWPNETRTIPLKFYLKDLTYGRGKPWLYNR